MFNSRHPELRRNAIASPLVGIQDPGSLDSGSRPE